MVDFLSGPRRHSTQSPVSLFRWMRGVAESSIGGGESRQLSIALDASRDDRFRHARPDTHAEAGVLVVPRSARQTERPRRRRCPRFAPHRPRCAAGHSAARPGYRPLDSGPEHRVAAALYWRDDLDPSAVEALLNTIRRLDPVSTVLIVSHDASMQKLTDRVFVLNDGRLVAQCPRDEFDPGHHDRIEGPSPEGET